METKVCTKCGRELPLDQFNWRDKAKGTRRADCKECHSGYMKAKYQEKKETIQDIKAELKCQKCGYEWQAVVEKRNKGKCSCPNCGK